ncbi:leucine Rich Repeat [Seminavis robusta]|uniref:Leucine Rich Repeat n=1 Tax=Seminavis robusta TaxID=568900 RepID=A0A9N8EU11_9STRA|nr:leucine Rich Repeat [Seminavis robusta]|eukprot:Sro1761_g295940.1 leucine Rich Repeat (923) ;mRNA; r:18457-21306
MLKSDNDDAAAPVDQEHDDDQDAVVTSTTKPSSPPVATVAFPPHLVDANENASIAGRSGISSLTSLAEMYHNHHLYPNVPVELLAEDAADSVMSFPTGTGTSAGTATTSGLTPIASHAPLPLPTTNSLVINSSIRAITKHSGEPAELEALQDRIAKKIIADEPTVYRRASGTGGTSTTLKDTPSSPDGPLMHSPDGTGARIHTCTSQRPHKLGGTGSYEVPANLEDLHVLDVGTECADACASSSATERDKIKNPEVDDASPPDTTTSSNRDDGLSGNILTNSDSDAPTQVQIPGAYAEAGSSNAPQAMSSSSQSESRRLQATAPQTTLASQDPSPDDSGLVRASLVQEDERSHLPVAQIMEASASASGGSTVQQQSQDGCKPCPRGMSKEAKVFLIVIGFLLAILVVVVAVAVAVRDRKQSSHVDPAAGRETAIKNRIAAALYGSSYNQTQQSQLFSSRSDQARALQWIVHHDPMHLSPDANHLLQRYFLAYFYHATTQQWPWTSCNDPQGDEPQSNHESHLCFYLQYVGDGTYIPDYTHRPQDFEETIANSWLSPSHECQWAGVFCNDANNRSKTDSLSHEKAVTDIRLDNMNLTGTLPEAREWGLVPELRALSVTYNGLTGTLPESFYSLTHLNLQNNQLTGAIPITWWAPPHTNSQQQKDDDGAEEEQSRLEYVNVEFNRLKWGQIPTEIGLLSQSLRYLLVSGTGINGTLPEEIYQLTNLVFLFLRLNDGITGTISSSLGMLSNLEVITLMGDTNMGGTLPSEIGLLTKVVEFDTWGAGLQGTIPEELYSPNMNINALILGQNNYSGTISSHMAKLPRLSYILLSGNTLMSGTVPSELGLMTELVRVDIDGTSISGVIPDEVCALRGDRKLSKVKADCLANSNDSNSTEEPFIPTVCPDGCCTKCCQRDTGECVKTGY